MPRLKLPVGIQSFASLREGGYTYVDKTPFIANLVNSGKVYFLSRPRRFGKSLLIDTMACAFSGRRELFKGLYLDTPESEWDWSKTNPVLRVDFAGGTMTTPQNLRDRIGRIIAGWCTEYSLPVSAGTPGEQLCTLIPLITKATGSTVVVLVDEYDKPILDTLEDPETAKAMRDILKDFYSALKPIDEHLRFVFLAGVSKFGADTLSCPPGMVSALSPSGRQSKTGIFSGLNNPNDITIDRRYSALCGYTQIELETVFAAYLAGYNVEEVREWYNGYSWTGEAVYNPFDILLLFDKGQFRPHWFETGTPTFLVKLWKDTPRNPAEYDGMIVGEEIIGSFEIEKLSPITLLFQSGYLTIKKHTNDAVRGSRFTLGFPNHEVLFALTGLFRDEVTGLRDQPQYGDRVYDAILSDNPVALRAAITAFLASIPHDWHRKNNIARFEGYWSTVIYTLFAGLGCDVIPEDTTNHGRIDMTVKTKQGIWIFEFKVKGHGTGGCASPLAQLRECGYSQKYFGTPGSDGKVLPVREIGIVFDPVSRNIERWEEGNV